jgi:hypothetical protein
MRTPSTRLLMVPLAALVLLTGATGCAATASDAAGPAGANPGPSATNEVAELVLPMNAYELTRNEEGQLSLAQTLVAADCMDKAGFGALFNVSVIRGNAEAALRNPVLNDGVYGNRQRYGVMDLDQATRYGFHLPYSLNTDPPSQSGLPDKATMSAAALSTMGNCFAEAERRVYGDWLTGPQPAADISKVSRDKSQSDPTVKSAIEQWVACVAAKGYTWDSPLGAGAEFTGQQEGSTVKNPYATAGRAAPDQMSKTTTPQEIVAAQADVACKKQTHVVDIWFAAEETYQKAQIEQHFQELQEYKAKTEALMRRAADIVAKS